MRTGVVGGLVLLVVGLVLRRSFHRQVAFCRSYGTQTFIVTHCARDEVLLHLGQIAVVVGPVALAVSLVLGILLTRAAHATRSRPPEGSGARGGDVGQGDGREVSPDP